MGLKSLSENKQFSPPQIRAMPADNKENFLNVRREGWICLFLVLITLFVYLQVGSFEFNNYDTDRYVYENRHVTSGLTIESIAWAFTTIYASNWHPVTWLSHMLDVQLFGLKSGRHHLSNVLLHIVNALLLFWILARMTGDIWKSSLVAALFAIHPLHIQSVAWVAERKDVLSAFFALLAVGCYLRYVRYPRIGRYIPVLLFFMLSLMSKPMLVTLPLVLLLLDYWPLKRFQFQMPNEQRSTGSQMQAKVFLIVEKIPLLLASAASCMVTLYAQQDAGAVGSLDLYPLHLRIVNALVSYTGYLAKMLWPVNLAVIYPYPGAFPAWQILASCLMLFGMSFLALKLYKSHPWLLVGWLWYLGTLVPVIGLVQAGTQAMADRYTYVPLIGMFIIIVWGLSELLERYRLKHIASAIIATAIVSSLTAISWHQVGYWENSITLFEHTLDVTNNNYAAHNNLGHRLLELGKTDDALRHFAKSIEINSEFEIAHLNLGLAFSRQGKLDQAIKHYSKALQIKPNYIVAHNNLGNAWYRLGKADKAYVHYLEAIKINPAYAEAYNNLGAVSIRMGDLKRAVFFFRKALKINPEFVGAQNNLKNTLAVLKKNE
jgi:tetratricopeptide (TPR) repeat protein